MTDDKTVIGFVTLTCSEIDLQSGYDLTDCSQANHYEFLPAVKIARLAVDARYRKNGLGSMLIAHAITLIVDKVAENVGCSFVVTDAKSEAIDFYEKQGLVLHSPVESPSTEHHLMFLDLGALSQ